MTTTADLFGKNRNLPSGPVAFIDPGLGGTGFAFWQDLLAASLQQEPTPPTMHGRWMPKRGQYWQTKFNDCIDWVERWIGMMADGVIVCIEAPELWTGSAKSIASASTGKLLKLAYLVGGMIRVCDTLDLEWVHISPGEWKGQLPKEAMKKRVAKLLGCTYKEHEYDSVGMGLAAMGWLDGKRK